MRASSASVSLSSGHDRNRSFLENFHEVRAAADVRQEIRQDGAAFDRVRHFRVKLQSIERARAMPNGRMRAGIRAGERNEIGADGIDLVAVAHPDLRLSGDAAEDIDSAFRLTDRAMGPAVLSHGMTFHTPAERLAH